MEFEKYFIKDKVSENSLLFKWNLNNIPKGYKQILLLADLIRHHTSKGYEIKLRPDKRNHAKGLLVIFVNKT